MSAQEGANPGEVGYHIIIEGSSPEAAALAEADSPLGYLALDGIESVQVEITTSAGRTYEIPTRFRPALADETALNEAEIAENTIDYTYCDWIEDPTDGLFKPAITYESLVRFAVATQGPRSVPNATSAWNSTARYLMEKPSSLASALDGVIYEEPTLSANRSPHVLGYYPETFSKLTKALGEEIVRGYGPKGQELLQQLSQQLNDWPTQETAPASFYVDMVAADLGGETRPMVTEAALQRYGRATRTSLLMLGVWRLLNTTIDKQMQLKPLTPEHSQIATAAFKGRKSITYGIHIEAFNSVLTAARQGAEAGTLHMNPSTDRLLESYREAIRA